jgi:DNA replication protein DnaC
MMRQLSKSDLTDPEVIHPNVLAAIHEWRETGVLNWTAPPGTPDPPAPPRCPVCHDVGEVAIRIPGQLTQYAPCMSCSIRVDRLIAKMPTDYRRTFDDFQSFAPTPELQALGQGALAWAERGEGSMLFIGPVGTFKTTLASAIYTWRCQHGMVRTAEWVSMPALIQSIRVSYDPETRVPVESLLIERVKRCDLLVLDEVGGVAITDRNAPWVQEQYYDVIEHRSSEHLATIMTSNLSHAQLKAQLGPAIASRIVGMCRGHIAVTGVFDDIRYAEVGK